MPKGISKTPEETRKKMSERMKGDKNPAKKPEVRRKISKTLQGHIESEETKQKIGKSHKGRPLFKMRGKKNPNWKGGITNVNRGFRNGDDYKMWHKACLERDNFTCQKCGQYGGKLEIHHKNNFAEFPDKRLAIDNGTTLCKKCHTEFHKKYGYQNNTKEQLEEFLNE
jgi:hypothetical protein